MRFQVDKKEISDFINLSFRVANSHDNVLVVSRFTAEIDETFLRNRASFIKSEIIQDADFNYAFCKLAGICNMEEQRCSICPVRNYCNTYINQCRQSVKDDAHKMIDLFCGAGGLSLGFTQEGFVTALANDIQECCVDTYAHNHPETPRNRIILGDVKDVVDSIEKLVDTNAIDIVVGGPPCQGFSMANRQRLIDDPRNYLYKNYVEIVRKVHPKFFVMENVKGMLAVAEQVKDDFRHIGYTVVCHVLNAKDYGVPQSRERLIYIGNRLGIDNDTIFQQIFDLSKKIPDYVLKDALFGLRKLEAARIKNATESENTDSGFIIERNEMQRTNEYIEYINQGRSVPFVCNHKARYNNDRDIEIYRRMTQGDKSDDPKIADIMPYKNRSDIFKDKYYKLVENNVCKTITAHMKFDCNMYIHPTQARGLTPREAARVQSYPDDYFFRGAYTKTYMQIGNSVPPLLGRAIASVVKRYL
ncbi:MAG: DNA (cytosine-5-)-methyltransferase [Treponemataceae bacterium]|nr:DNA (cytosine-5-)-methyltransferase [Treponemataceae bacterium]